MTLEETMASLEAAGSEQTRKTYRRHGITREMHGVSYAHLEKLRKRIKLDHALAGQLWDTGNHDARVLAMMVADPAQSTAQSLSRWAEDLDHSLIGGALAKLAGKSSAARACFEKWSQSPKDPVSSAAWTILATLAMSDSSLPDAYFEKQLKVIEKGIHKAPNDTKYAMNSALIAIGIRNPKLEKQALAAAGRIGKVEVDHGDTACKTPDAAAYIRKTVARRKG